MNMSPEKGLELVSEIKGMVRDEVNTNTEVIVCPTFIHLSSVGALLRRDSMIKLGAQNCHYEASGAFTGEISVQSLKELGCTYVILGHSERRAYFGEDSELLNKKIKAVLKQSLHPIYCCGESLKERESGKEKEVVGKQIEEVLSGLTAEEMKLLVIAYEPVWAIGTGKTASEEQAQEMHAFIRSLIAELFSKDIAEDIPILYGGSVKPGNASSLFSQKDIDGGLIGGASLDSRSFTDIAKAL